MKVYMKRTLGDYKAGETYDVPDWEGRRFVNSGAANPVLPQKQEKAEAAEAAEKKRAAKKTGRRLANPLRRSDIEAD